MASSVSLCVTVASSVSHCDWPVQFHTVWLWPVPFHSLDYLISTSNKLSRIFCDRNGTFYGLKSCLHHTWELSFDAHHWTFSRIYCYLCSFYWPNNSFAKLPFVPLCVKYVANLYHNHRQFRLLWSCSSLCAWHLLSTGSNSLCVDSPPRHPPL